MTNYRKLSAALLEALREFEIQPVEAAEGGE